MNVLVLLVPWAGLEFARIHERQLLLSLERDMRNQAVLAREIAEDAIASGRELESPRVMRILVDAARTTRTRVRVLDERAVVRIDSHAWGPPEGPEPLPPTVVPQEIYDLSNDIRRSSARVARWSDEGDRWPLVADRREVREALAGRPSAYTRLRAEHPSVILFVTEPIRHRGSVTGAIYVTRSTQPVLEELYKIRAGLTVVMGVAVFLTALLTLVLAWSISRPLTRLARAARRIAAGERDVVVPVGGSGEIRDLSHAFATMTAELDRRLRYISEFAADVAHEFKSPLTSIRGAAELLGEGASDDPETRERFLRNIQLDADRLDRLVSRLLELSRIEASREPMGDVDLAALITRVVERTQSPDPRVEVHAPATLPPLRGRENDLERALLNLVENAIRFSPPGRPVSITIELARDAIHLAVRDHGSGVAPEHRARIFERFFTTDAERNGTGLGLSIVKSVAEAHGGRVRLDEHTTPGARFVITLPLGARGSVRA
ncbi:sensor histidine kinase [Sandaracinus amylolyticus]|uniref:histidine kinase n=1 Tax=Sandaracinus amylolyticus TaxID=927083 RepID=A0A0F6W313_9BACT|nr:ATP-binding protein [Sandaracinus amylolyticus]AKF06117.1 Two-component sensor histidine kinase [Sandaracinus amylolyticus]